MEVAETKNLITAAVLEQMESKLHFENNLSVEWRNYSPLYRGPFLEQQRAQNNSPKLVNTQIILEMPGTSFLPQPEFQVPFACLAHDEVL